MTNAGSMSTEGPAGTLTITGALDNEGLLSASGAGPLTVGGALILFGGWYLLSARKWFTGPVREAGTDEEPSDIEQRMAH